MKARRKKVVWIGLLVSVAVFYILRPAVYHWRSADKDLDDRECGQNAKGDPNAIQVGKPDPRVTEAAQKVQPRKSGAIKTIQLTDAGAYVARCQLTAALVEFTRTRHGLDDVGKKLVVLYIHGWRNDHRQSDGDYVSFKALIDDLTKANAGKKHVVGIYVSWEARGIPILEYATFWSRMFAADRIAQSGTVASIIGAASNIVRADNHDSELIAIGHSFGARILFSSVQQNFLFALARAHPGYPKGTYKKIEPIADGVILLNPAFEASIYARLDAQKRLQEKFDPAQPPLLVSISSSADWATQVAFPIGQLAAGWLPGRDTTTVGNYKRYWTHELRKSATCEAEESIDFWKGFSHDGLCMLPKQGVVFPFHMVTTDASVIGGHSDIWNPKFSKYLFELVKKMSERARPPSYVGDGAAIDLGP